MPLVGARLGFKAAGVIAPVLLTPPAGLGWTPSFNIYRTSSGVYTTDFDPTTLRPAVTKNYNVDLTGNDGGSGQGTGTGALASISVAIAKSDGDKVTIEDGNVDGTIYRGTRGWNAVSPAVGRSLWITTRNGKRITSVKAASVTPPTWTLVSGASYSTPVSGVTGAATDLKYRGSLNLFQRLSRATSATTTPAPGQYWHDTAGAVGTANLYYVTASDSRALTDNLMVPPASGNNGSINISTDVAPTIYIENIDFVGGVPFNAQALTALTGRPKIVFINCTFQNSVGSEVATTGSANGTSLLGGFDLYFVDCVAGGCLRDGFNRHSGDGSTTFGQARAFLLRCSTARNGFTTDTNNNAETQHETSIAIALGCNFRNGNNRNVDYIDNSRGWILDSDLGPSLASDATGISVHSGGTAIIWLDGDRIVKSTYGDLMADAAGGILTRNMDLTGLTTSNVGTY